MTKQDAGAFVKTVSLSKYYGRLKALDECTLDVQRGEVFGLLGPNGAGKTTLLRLLLGFLSPTSGRATIGGLDCQRQSLAVRKIVSYLPGEARLFRQMRARDVLKFFADIRPDGSMERSRELAEVLELDLSPRVAFLSTGMRQKLALTAALAADVPLLILDEPTSNLDPTVRATVMRLVTQAKRAGRTVLFSSHVLSEVEEVCDRVAILRRGQVVHLQVLSELRRRHRIRAQLDGPIPAPPEALRGELNVQAAGDGQVMIETLGELSPVLGWLATLPLREVRVEPIGLRAIYDRFHGNRTEPDQDSRNLHVSPVAEEMP